ncbi:MAG TPA: AMP-binding protein [Mycobacteriales bacterium]|nr:AMP-binding protein [Mycobacteriales bacterium]
MRPDYARPGGPWDVPPLSQLPAPAVVDGDVRRESGEVSDRAARLAAWLRGRGVGHGDRVSFGFGPGEDALLAYLACWRIGAVAAPFHHRATAVERDALLARIGPRLSLDAIPLLDEQPTVEPAGVAGDDLAVLLPTSGSSGVPKLVRHTHRGLAGKARAMVATHQLRADDVVLMPAPMAHISGLLNGLLLPGQAGMTVVFMARWDADAALQLIAREHVSFMIGPPTYFVQLMRSPNFSPERVVSLRLLSCGGAGVTEDFCRAASDAFGARVKRTYGSTEAPTVTTSYADDDPALGWSTDGRPVGDAELRVADTGELSVRGPELFEGYDGDPATTAAVLDDDGWFRTGDRARIDDGWLTILGRIGDTIIRGGENVEPAEVERVCGLLPGVSQAVVVGYPDDVMGHRVGLVVVADHAPTVDEVRAHCAAHGLARFKHPERVLSIDVLPIRTVGKPDRAALSVLLAADATT